MSGQCPFYSRAYGVRCELQEGHASLCDNGGAGFAGGADDTWWDQNRMCINCGFTMKQHAGAELQCLFAPTKFRSFIKDVALLNGKAVVR